MLATFGFIFKLLGHPSFLMPFPEFEWFLQVLLHILVVFSKDRYIFGYYRFRKYFNCVILDICRLNILFVDHI